MSRKVKQVKTKKKHNRADWRLTLMALPFVIYIIVFKYMPLMGWGLAFTNYRPGRKLENLQFVGLKYFKLIGYYWEEVERALINTLTLSLLALAIMWLPMLFSICLNEITNSKLKKIVQTLVTLPHFVSWVITYSVMFALFSSSGMLNTVLMNWGLINKPTQLLTNANLAQPLMVIVDVWKETGWNSIVYLAAIAGIDAALYEAARVDGAGRLACAWYITVPSLMPTFVVLLIMNVGKLLNVGLDKYLMFSNPITLPKLEVLDMFTYRVGIMTQDCPLATSVSILKSIVSITLVLIANMIAKKVRGATVI